MHNQIPRAPPHGKTLAQEILLLILLILLIRILIVSILKLFMFILILKPRYVNVREGAMHCFKCLPKLSLMQQLLRQYQYRL